MMQSPPTHSAASTADTESSARVNPIPSHSPRVGPTVRGAVHDAEHHHTDDEVADAEHSRPPQRGADHARNGRGEQHSSGRNGQRVDRPDPARPDRPARLALPRQQRAERRAAAAELRTSRDASSSCQILQCRRFRDGDPDPASLWRIHHFDCAAVQFDRPPGDRQAQSGATCRRGAAGEALEDPFAFGRRDPGAVVAHLQPQPGSVRPHSRAPRRGRLSGCAEWRCPPG